MKEFTLKVGDCYISENHIITVHETRGLEVIDLNKQVPVKAKILREGVELPSYATLGSSGMDVRAYAYSNHYDLKTTYELKQGDKLALLPNERILIKTGLAFAIPDGYEIQVRDRSGCALKSGIMLVNGVGTCDSDYRGEVGIILYNSDTEPFVIEHGDRVAQLVLQKVPKAKLILVDDLDETDRGAGGYNSTGVK